MRVNPLVPRVRTCYNRGIVKRLLLVLALAATAGPQAVAMELPLRIDLGTVVQGDVARIEVPLANESGTAAYFDFMSPCPCIVVDPPSVAVPAGAAETVTFSFDPAGYSGSVEKVVLVRSSIERYDRALLHVRADVEADEVGESEACGDCARLVEQDRERTERLRLERAWLVADVYYPEGCHDCEELIHETIPAIRRELGISVSIRKHNVLEPAQYELFINDLERRGVEPFHLPVVVIGDAVLAGNGLSPERLREVMARLSAADRDAAPAARPSNGDAGSRPDGASSRSAAAGGIAAPAVLVAGLVDGVNPCAFATLLFLLSSLMVVGKNRREILITGAVFATTVFATYFAVGLGLFQALRAASLFPIVAEALRWLMAAVLVAFAGLSVYDFILVRRGEASRMVLQLPDRFKKRIHESVRRGVRGYSLVAGTVAMGIAVSLFELGCTGQIYLPTISYMVQTGGGAIGYGLLVLYNVGFIAPLVALFAAVYLGIGSDGLLRFFRSNLGRMKLALAGVFGILAVLMVFS